ncbi:hypothetical protein LGQ03_07160 [Loktanella sp. TSTF-M6]|uniref:Uncharacterized protein n=1 Tax=Loktanella gaetbuli TaxID=2881335 RepID=A0ABS8BTE4_9RHOB|nr:hypothetical protein [Loktanella gaetbuli]MCB5199014.1 hypothetical protein [Loktanella gaetbuli]
MADFLVTNRKTSERQIVSATPPVDLRDLGFGSGIYDLHRLSPVGESLVRGNNTIADVVAVMPSSFRLWAAGHGDFQDVAASTPAAVGDPVGYWTEHSGNMNSATRNGSDTSRPILRQDGGAMYWEFDAVDDRMNTDFAITGPSLTMGMSYGYSGRNVIPMIYVSSGTRWAFAATVGSSNEALTSSGGGTLREVYIDNVQTPIANRGEAATALTGGKSFMMNISDGRNVFEAPYFGGPFSNFTMPERVHAVFVCGEELTDLQRGVWHDFAIAAATTGVSAS